MEDLGAKVGKFGRFKIIEMADVKRLVAGIHLLSHVTTKGQRNSVEDLRVMLLSVSDDIRVILIIAAVLFLINLLMGIGGHPLFSGPVFTR